MKSLKWNSIRHMLSRYSGIEFTQRQKNTNRRTITNEMKRKKMEIDMNKIERWISRLIDR